MDKVESLIHNRVSDLYKNMDGTGDVPDWKLEDYHNSIGKDDAVHGALMRNPVRYYTLDEDLLSALLREPMTDIMQHYWGHRNPLITHIGHENSTSAPVADNACCFRFVRPGIRDVAGVHVDTYYATRKDAYTKSLEERVTDGASGLDLLTAWVPVVGNDERFSLRFSPGSHKLDHPAELFQQSPQHMTRAVDKEYENKFEYIRPKLSRGQAIIFHPNMLHGGSFNLGETTRVSLEIRFRDRKDATPNNLA